MPALPTDLVSNSHTVTNILTYTAQGFTESTKNVHVHIYTAKATYLR